MQIHGPKRVYTQGSLEFWFGKLELPWDSFFPDEHLKSGRELYRYGGIRGVELGINDAIIHVKFDKKEEYSVIEWDEKGLVVRSSTADPVLANTIAIAGLHEIEELVADEISAVLDVEEEKKEIQKVAAPRIKRKKINGFSRKLLLVLKSTSGGLICDPYWVDGRNGRQKALGNGTSTNQLEREKVISLTAQARKAHLKFCAEKQAFVLNESKEIPFFLKNVLSNWKGKFEIEKDENVLLLQKGVRSVQIEARARHREGNTLDLEWIFKSGKQLLTGDQVKQLRANQGKSMIIPGLGMLALSEDNVGRIETWEASLEELSLKELPAYMLFSLFSDKHWELNLSPELQKWKESLFKGHENKYRFPPILRPYQRHGVEWLAQLCDLGCHGLLADEMGLGKTLQILSLIKCRPEKGKRHLVVCPASVVPVWLQEIRRFFPDLKFHVLSAGSDFLSEKEPGIWVSSYAQLRNHREMLSDIEFGYAVLDEGQFIKNPDAKVTNTCFEIKALHRIVSTGTPLENRQLDLWSLFHFLLPGLLGTRQLFETSLGEDHEATMERLRIQLAPFILRRTKAEVAKELPHKVETNLLCPLTDLQKQEYARICNEGLKRLGEDIGEAMEKKSFSFLSLLTRLRQACCDPHLLPWIDSEIEESGKLGMLAEKLEEAVSGGHKVVIFSQFVTLLKRVEDLLIKRFPDLPRFQLTGASVDRQKPVEDFQRFDGSATILVSLRAAGTGITLHTADYVFLLDPWWNPAVEEQAIDRVHRIGQTKTVFVYRMVTEGTVEERIQMLKVEKKALFDRIVGRASSRPDIRKHFKKLDDLIGLG